MGHFNFKEVSWKLANVLGGTVTLNGQNGNLIFFVILRFFFCLNGQNGRYGICFIGREVLFSPKRNTKKILYVTFCIWNPLLYGVCIFQINKY